MINIIAKMLCQYLYYKIFPEFEFGKTSSTLTTSLNNINRGLLLLFKADNNSPIKKKENKQIVTRFSNDGDSLTQTLLFVLFHKLA